MDNHIKNIYNMVYSPIITPYNLLENAKLDNYSYVKYYKDREEFVVEMQCEIINEGEKKFFYYFDQNDFLQKVYVKNNENMEILFNREDALTEAISDYYDLKPELSNVV